MSDAIGEILSATDSVELFGPIEKRAKIRYRRLAREAHPDANGNSDESNEAMKRLNKLWREYKTRTTPRTDRAKATFEITRNKSFVIVSDGTEWMMVERQRHHGDVKRYGAWDDIRDILDGTPVCLMDCDREKVISQPDGLHMAYDFKPHETIRHDRRIMMLSSIRPMLPDNVMHPADFAWVTKRVLFLSCVLAESGVTLDCDDMTDCLAIAPDTHMLAVMARIVKTDHAWECRDRLLRQYVELMDTMLDDLMPNVRVRKFVNGVIGDRWANARELMGEYDELLMRTFGGINFHYMVTIE